MKQFSIIRLSLAAVGVFILISCSSNFDEPSSPAPRKITRSDVLETPHTLSRDEVMASCKKVLKKESDTKLATLTPILACNENLKDNFLSDTIAYVVNHPNNGGFAIIANDSRVKEILAYSDKNNFSEDNLLAKYFFINKIEGYLASVLNNDSKEPDGNNPDKIPVKHFVIDPQITVELGPWAPFNRVVEKNHPGCSYTGLSNVAAATIISHLTDTLIYNNYLYNFPSIIGALNNNVERIADFPDITYPGGEHFLIKFHHSYVGSVSAFSQLIYDIGVASKTTYKPTYTWTSPLLVLSTIKKMGFETTLLNFDKDIKKICSFLSDGYLISMFGIPRDDDGNLLDISFLYGPVSWVVDGCDIMLNSNNEPVSGMLHIVWGLFGIGDDYYSYPVLLSGNNMNLEDSGYFGVK